MSSQASRVTALQRINQELRRQLQARDDVISRVSGGAAPSPPQHLQFQADWQARQLRLVCAELEAELQRQRTEHLRQLQRARSEFSGQAQRMKKKALGAYEQSCKLSIENESLRRRIEVLEQLAALKG